MPETEKEGKDAPSTLAATCRAFDARRTDCHTDTKSEVTFLRILWLMATLGTDGEVKKWENMS